MRSWLLGAFSLTAIVGSARADGSIATVDSLNDLLGPREIAVGEAMRGGATGASAIGMNPAGLPLNHELVFEGGYGYRATDSASLIGASACDSTNAMPGCFFYNYAGENPELGGMTMHRTTHVGGLALSKQLVPRVMIGATAKYYHFDSDMSTDKSASGTAFDVGATLRLTEIVNVGVSGQNIWATTDSPMFPRAIGGGIFARPMPNFAVSFDARWRLDDHTAARYGGGAELFLTSDNNQNGWPIRLGALHDNSTVDGGTYLSAGLGYASPHWGIDISGRKQIKGGDDNLIIASMRFFGPREAGPPIE